MYIFIYEYMYKYTAPPLRHGQFDRHVGCSPPTLRNFFRVVRILVGESYARRSVTLLRVSAEMMNIGLGVW